MVYYLHSMWDRGHSECFCMGHHYSTNFTSIRTKVTSTRQKRCHLLVLRKMSKMLWSLVVSGMKQVTSPLKRCFYTFSLKTFFSLHGALCVIFLILVSLENVKICVLGGCTITSKTKINIVWNFSHSAGSFWATPFEKFSNVDFSLWGIQCIVSRKWDQNCENHT